VPITVRLEALERTQTCTLLPLPPVPSFDHETLMRELHAALMSHIIASWAESIDYELLISPRLSCKISEYVSCHPSGVLPPHPAPCHIYVDDAYVPLHPMFVAAAIIYTVVVDKHHCDLAIMWPMTSKPSVPLPSTIRTLIGQGSGLPMPQPRI
jgi:hypothetical protein